MNNLLDTYFYKIQIKLTKNSKWQDLCVEETSEKFLLSDSSYLLSYRLIFKIYFNDTKKDLKQLKKLIKKNLSTYFFKYSFSESKYRIVKLRFRKTVKKDTLIECNKDYFCNFSDFFHQILLPDLVYDKPKNKKKKIKKRKIIFREEKHVRKNNVENDY